MQIDPINWQHILIEGSCYLIPTLGAGYLGYRKLMWTLGEYRPHRHDEDKKDVPRTTTLTVEGLSYPRSMNGK